MRLAIVPPAVRPRPGQGGRIALGAAGRAAIDPRAMPPVRHGVPALIGIATGDVAALAAPLRQRGPFGIGGQVLSLIHI